MCWKFLIFVTQQQSELEKSTLECSENEFVGAATTGKGIWWTLTFNSIAPALNLNRGSQEITEVWVKDHT